MWPALARFFDASPHSHPRRLRELIDRHGGFTMRLRSYEPVASGICVCTQPSRSISFPRDQWDDEIVDGWVMAAASRPLWRATTIGGWLDRTSDTVWLDLVRVVPTPLRQLAFLLGRAARQHCVFDLERGQTFLVR